MNKAELIQAVAMEANVPRKDAETIVTATFDVITDMLKEGEKVQLIGFGSFDVKYRAARMGRNPRTLEEVPIPAMAVPQFKPGKILKEVVANSLKVPTEE